MITRYPISRTRITGFSILLAGVLSASCAIAPYETLPVPPFDMPIDDAIVDPDEPLDRRYRGAVEHCRLIQSRMLAELEAHRARERQNDMIFGGISFLLGLGTAIYSAADETPDPTVTAVAGSLSAATAVPAFLTTGGRARVEELNKRTGGVETARAVVEASAAKALTATQDFTKACQSMRDLGAPVAELVRSGCTPGEGYEPRSPAPSREAVTAVQSSASDAYVRSQAAKAEFSQALSNYVYVCGRGA